MVLLLLDFTLIFGCFGATVCKICFMFLHYTLNAVFDHFFESDHFGSAFYIESRNVLY